MLVVDVGSVLLVFVLARRLGLSRLAGFGAALAFGLSPVALSYHRMVLLDNLATPLLLAAMVLALSPRRRLSHALGAGLALGAAVLVKETLLLIVPFVAWLLWRNALERTRKMTVMVAVIGFTLVTVMYPLFALVKGELLPGRGHVSLWAALVFQLAGRTSSGSVLSADSDAHSIVAGWMDLDPYLLVAGAVLSVGGLSVRRIRPVAAALLFLVLMMLRPGYLPVPYVVALLPLAALVVAGVVDAVLRLVPLQRLRTGRLRFVDAAAGVAVVLLAALTVSAVHTRVQPDWYYRDQALMHNNFDEPYQQSTRWLVSQLPRGSSVLVDNVTRTDLLAAGFPADRVVWFTKLDVDPDVAKRYPKASAFDYVVSTDIMRTSREAGPSLRDALDHSTPVARFGTGSRTIVIKEVR
jgi:4-amino-4-deoxy-L-arabinose transferase-like glycosyltransferase